MSSSMVNTRRGLAGWVWEIDLSGWFDPAVSFADARFGIAAALRESSWNYVRDPCQHVSGMALDQIVEMMEEADSVDRFDALLNTVFDMADRDRVWIITGPDCQTCVVV